MNTPAEVLFRSVEPAARAWAESLRGHIGLPSWTDMDELTQVVRLAQWEVANHKRPVRNYPRLARHYARWRVIEWVRQSARPFRYSRRYRKAPDCVSIEAESERLGDAAFIGDAFTMSCAPDSMPELPRCRAMGLHDWLVVLLVFWGDWEIERVGDYLGVTASRVSQIKARALRKLRRAYRATAYYPRRPRGQPDGA